MPLPERHFRRLIASCALQRVLATACVLLVLALMVMEASPELHHALHPDSDHADHECAVTLFAHGVTTALPFLAAAAVIWAVGRGLVPAVLDLVAGRPTYTLPFALGPPVA